MSKYIALRDKAKASDFCVTLSELIEMVLKDGCCSFAEWKLVCFKRHAHGSTERAVFTKIMSNVRADFMIRNCEDYLRNHYMWLNFIECCNYISHRFEADNYYSKDETHDWIKPICAHNNILFGEF
jgi:hypothetical protein